VAKYVITKGLNKAPNEYPDAKSQPHLQVCACVYCSVCVCVCVCVRALSRYHNSRLPSHHTQRSPPDLRVCARACVRTCVRAFVCACVRVTTQVALGMMKAGKPVNVGDHIPYVICEPPQKAEDKVCVCVCACVHARIHAMSAPGYEKTHLITFTDPPHPVIVHTTTSPRTRLCRAPTAPSSLILP
jgi:hypothetical protein